MYINECIDIKGSFKPYYMVAAVEYSSDQKKLNKLISTNDIKTTKQKHSIRTREIEYKKPISA